MDSGEHKLLGHSVPRKEGRDKVTGRARYVDDLDFPGALYGATVRSDIPRGRIRKIEFGGGIPWSEFTLVTAADIPGANYVALFERDQPFLAAGVVNHPEEPIVLLAHARSLFPGRGAAGRAHRIRRAARDFHAR